MQRASQHLKVPDTWPRGMRAKVAAAYVGLSVGTLEGNGPQPVFLTPGCKIWLKEDLDNWLDRKSGKAQLLEPANEWMESLDSD